MAAKKLYKRDSPMEEERSIQPTKEELQFLQLRAKLKQDIKKKHMKTHDQPAVKHHGSFSYDHFGSFFGSSQPAIAARLLNQNSFQVSLQNTNLEPKKISDSNNNTISTAPNKDKISGDCSSSNKPSSAANQRTVTNINTNVGSIKNKAQMLRVMRDYSFLSSNNSADKKVHIPSNCSVPRDPGTINLNNNNTANTPRLRSPSAVSKKDTTKKGESGVDSGKKINEKAHFGKVVQPKEQTTKISGHSASQLRSPNPKGKKAITNNHVARHNEEGKKSSINSRAMISNMIRNIFGYDPSKYEYDDKDDDDRCMEVSFGDIEREERRSARIARKEDQEELRKIKAEANKESLEKKAAKKRKITPSS